MPLEVLAEVMEIEADILDIIIEEMPIDNTAENELDILDEYGY